MPDEILKKGGDANYRDIPKKMQLEYDHGAKDLGVRAIEGVFSLLQHFQKRQISLRELMLEAATMMNKQFGIAYVAIGVKSPNDGRFRYEVAVGFREEAVSFRKKVSYDKSDFYDAGPYKGYWISKYTKIFLAEDHPYANGEQVAYNRPILLDLKRRSLSDSMEGDYIDTMIFGPDNELIGWIEYSGTRTGKMPDMMTLKSIEAIAGIIAAAMAIQREH